MALRDYAKEQHNRTKVSRAARGWAPTGVKCTERGCSGEMGWIEPRQQHPQLTELARAACNKCQWRGWC